MTVSSLYVIRRYTLARTSVTHLSFIEDMMVSWFYLEPFTKREGGIHVNNPFFLLSVNQSAEIFWTINIFINKFTLQSAMYILFVLKMCLVPTMCWNTSADHEEFRVKLKASPLNIDNKCPEGFLRQALLKWWLWDELVVLERMYF